MNSPDYASPADKPQKKKSQPKRLGGCTGKGFAPGMSGNPRGRPRTQGLSNALRIALAECDAEGRTVEEHLVAALIREALRGKRRLPAILAIFDRLEGRPHQSIQVQDQNPEIKDKSIEELDLCILYGHWPTSDELAEYVATIAQRGRPHMLQRAVFPDEQEILDKLVAEGWLMKD